MSLEPLKQAFSMRNETRQAYRNGRYAGIGDAAHMLRELAKLECEAKHADTFRYAAMLLDAHQAWVKRYGEK